jgi:hypothetical protein
MLQVIGFVLLPSPSCIIFLFGLNKITIHFPRRRFNKSTAKYYFPLPQDVPRSRGIFVILGWVKSPMKYHMNGGG